MWVIATYQSTSLFSLKPATATASGGRTLLVPTPYAIKMALLDVGCRLIGKDAAADIWDAWLGETSVALKPAQDVVVNNTFIKFLRKKEFKTSKDMSKEVLIDKAKQKKQYPFYQTIAYREYAQLAGDFSIALEVDTQDEADIVYRWLAHINYLGKRGSFIQLQAEPYQQDALQTEWLIIGESLEEGFALDSILTQLDDTGESATFDHINIYSNKGIKMGKQRILHHVALPYQRVRSSRSYTHYQLNTEDA